MNLCYFSRSEILKTSVLRLCPLSLTSSQHKICPCKTRRYHVPPADLRVVECTFPKKWNGEAIIDPDRFRKELIEIVQKLNGSSETMSTSVAVAESQGLWCGIKIPILGVTGEKGHGKTLFVSSIDPQRTAMIDLEDSSASYNLPFAQRWNLYDEMLKKFGRVPTPLECFLWFRETIEAIKPGQFTVLVVDPISDIEQGLVDWIYDNPQQFGHTKAQYDKGGGLMWGDVKSYWKLLLGIVSTKVETFAFTTHMGAVWKGSQPVEGKRKPKGKETLFELASLYLQVERKPEADGKTPDKPTARVLKSRLAKTEFKDGEFIHTPILPPYLKIATPKAIREYIINPPDYKKLKKSEIAPPETMSDEDKLVIQAEIAQNERVAEEAKLTRIELMRQAAMQQAAVLQQRDERQQANVAMADAASADASRSNGKSDRHEMLSDAKAAGENHEAIGVRREIAEFFGDLNMTGDQIQKALAKRGVSRVEELDLAKAQELREKLFDLIQKKKGVTLGN